MFKTPDLIMRFMRIIIQGPGHAFYNMAIDEAISEAVTRKLSPPTLRLYEWDRPSISIGYFQKTSDIDTRYCSKKGYPLVRRLTGGRAILHDAELTYSLSSLSNTYLFNNSLIKTYTVISNALLRGLKQNGIEAHMSGRKRHNSGNKNPACFKSMSYGEIKVNGKKIIGSAQKRYKDGFLQHGSILMNFNAEEMHNVLICNDDADFNDIGAIREYSPDLSLSQLIVSLKEAFEKELGVKLVSDNPSKFELSLAKELEQNKYSTEKWNFVR